MESSRWKAARRPRNAARRSSTPCGVSTASSRFAAGFSTRQAHSSARRREPGQEDLECFGADLAGAGEGVVEILDQDERYHDHGGEKPDHHDVNPGAGQAEQEGEADRDDAAADEGGP